MNKWSDIRCGETEALSFLLEGQSQGVASIITPGSIATWDHLEQKFLAMYFPPSKATKMRNDIMTFGQQEFESLGEEWERFKELWRRCPHHGLEKWMLLQSFSNGLLGLTRVTLDAAAGGNLMNKSDDEAYELLEQMTMNRPSERTNPRREAGVYELDTANTLHAQIAALHKKIDAMSIHLTQVPATTCENCGGEHQSNQCAIVVESTNFIGNNPRSNPFSNINSILFMDVSIFFNEFLICVYI
ncbi:hypothetical protein CDL15_Pgr016382 [Punica granatum]|uniref:Retrotransposon gag domain-containing protein n=1 Tax=Punica granatum TaxID=22663 RepID=A0A218W7V3_PUNGR|nr:hypothetical protein CDL15_Pgr016382 [Punica granatum]